MAEAENEPLTEMQVTVPPPQTPGNRPIRCVVCTSDPEDEGEACITRPLDFVKECIPPAEVPYHSVLGLPLNYTGCRKIEQWVDYDLNVSDPRLSNHHRILRHCAYYGMRKPCMHSANLGGKQYTCYCRGDACNAAEPRLLGSLSPMALITLTVLLTLFPGNVFAADLRIRPPIPSSFSD